MSSTTTGARDEGALVRSMLRLAAMLAACVFLAACAARRSDERVISPGQALDTGHITEGISRWRLTVAKGDSTRELGVMTGTTQFADYMGQPAILVVRTVPTPQGEIVDSVLVLRRTLAPVWERSHQPAKTMRLVGTGNVKLPRGGEREAWKLTLADPFIISTFRVDRETRRVLLEEAVSRKTGLSFRQEPLL